MPKLIILRGLPGSGKSTWARDQMKRDGNIVRVNRDELRAMMHPGLGWTKEREQRVVAAERSIAEAALCAGKDVIVDDTNILGAGATAWQVWAAALNNHLPTLQVTTVVEDFVARARVEECIRRDRQRLGCVGRGVIERMALFGGLLDFSAERFVAIVDVDGTLANLDHRLHLIEKEPKDYDTFFGRVTVDTPILPVGNAVNELFSLGYYIIVLSGRPAHVGDATSQWLNRWVNYHRLFMRQSGDHRPDAEAKAELFEGMLASGLRKDAIKVVLDDRDTVCDVWEKQGLPLIKVDHGRLVYERRVNAVTRKIVFESAGWEERVAEKETGGVNTATEPTA